MIYQLPFPDDDTLTHGVLLRRLVGWCIDAAILALLMLALWLGLLVFGFVTLGLGFGAMSVLPFVPFCYNVLFLASPLCATPGQHLMGLVVLRNADLGRPDILQAVIFTLVYYLTLATTGLLLLIALLTIRRRTLHDLASGLVVVRTEALQPLTPPFGYGNMQGGSPYA
jgi:uncharacterized RDD family membrane protein YckC